jgi:hypothetical protein
MFWGVFVFLCICNGLLAWEGTTFKDMDPIMRPPIANTGWFQIATVIGGIGWLVVPAMFYWQYGFFGAIAGFAAYLVSGLVVGLALKGAGS